MSSSAGRSILQRITRSFRTTTPKASGHDPEGFAGSNIPLPIGNRYVVLFSFIAFFGSGISVPFLVLRYHLKK